MQKYVKIYLSYFDLGEQDLITCEACMKQGRIDGGGFDIHHVYGRGEGREVITNLMALCRKHHNSAHTNITKSEMQMIHNYFMMGTRKAFLK
jgi:hypothetical protein